MWHEIFVAIYFCKLAIFGVLQKLTFAITVAQIEEDESNDQSKRLELTLA